MLSLAVSVLLSISGGGAAPSAPSPKSCKFIEKRQTVDRIDQLPSGIAEDFRRRYPFVTEPDVTFQRDDVSDSNKTASIARFAGAAHLGYQWIIWYEHGGQYHMHVISYMSASSTQRVDGDYMIQPYASLVGPPCDATKALVAGVRSPSPEDR